MRKMLALGAWLALMVGGIGCMGDSSDSSGGYSAGVDSATKLSELSDADAKKVCNSASDFVKGYVNSGQYEEFTCRLFALAYGAQVTDGQVDTCNTQYDMCMKQVSIAVTPTATCTPPAQCTATVADLEQCLNDQAAEVGGIDLPDCGHADFSMFGVDMLDMYAPEDPHSCMSLESECPGASELINPDVQVSGLPGT